MVLEPMAKPPVLETVSMLQVYDAGTDTRAESAMSTPLTILGARTAARALALGAAIAALLFCGRGAIAGPDEAIGRQVRPIIADVLSAWDRADSRAIAAQYDPDGDFVSPDGMHAAGRRAIAAFYEGAFDRGYAGSRASAEVIHVRSLSATVVLADGSWSIEPTPASKVRQPESGLFFAVLHRQGGRWRIAALREQASAQTLHEIDATEAAPHSGR
jgi:uncharacterized protein (TIGR02246 family)